MSVRPQRARTAFATAATVTACLAAAAIPAAPALADDTESSSRRPRTIHVTGLLTLTDAKTGAYAATGDLVGTWTIPPTTAVDYYNTSTTIIQKGTESFDGCLVVGKKQCGTLNSEYISWSYLKPSGRLISGGCVHAPTGGTKAFKGVRGLLLMTDTPVGDDVNTLYQGEVILNAEAGEGSTPVPVPSARIAATSVKATAGSC